MFVRETSKGPDLIVTAFTRALPQGALYNQAQEDENSDPKSYKNCYDHNTKLAAIMPRNKTGRYGVKSPQIMYLYPKRAVCVSKMDVLPGIICSCVWHNLLP